MAADHHVVFKLIKCRCGTYTTHSEVLGGAMGAAAPGPQY